MATSSMPASGSASAPPLPAAAATADGSTGGNGSDSSSSPVLLDSGAGRRRGRPRGSSGMPESGPLMLAAVLAVPGFGAQWTSELANGAPLRRALQIADDTLDSSDIASPSDTVMLVGFTLLRSWEFLDTCDTACLDVMVHSLRHVHSRSKNVRFLHHKFTRAACLEKPLAVGTPVRFSDEYARELFDHCSSHVLIDASNGDVHIGQSSLFRAWGLGPTAAQLKRVTWAMGSPAARYIVSGHIPSDVTAVVARVAGHWATNPACLPPRSTMRMLRSGTTDRGMAESIATLPTTEAMVPYRTSGMVL